MIPYSTLYANNEPVLVARNEGVSQCKIRTCSGFTVNGAVGTCSGNIHSECTLSCDTPLYTGGSGTYVCGTGNTYTPKTANDALTCTRLPCTDAVTVPTGATTTCTSAAYTQSCTVSCSMQNYQTSVFKTLTCGAGGVWSGAQLTSCPSTVMLISYSCNFLIPVGVRF